MKIWSCFGYVNNKAGIGDMALCFVEEEEVCGENFPRFFCVLARIFPFCKIYDEDRENPILLL